MKHKSLTKNAFLNTINQVCSIVFQLISFPYVSRVLQTENYGKVTFANSIMSYFLLLAALGTTNYAVREGSKLRDNKTSLEKFVNEVFSINFLASIISSVLLVIICFLCFDEKSSQILLIILGAQVILNVFNVDWINNVYEDFTFLAIRNIVIQIISLLLIILLIHNNEDYYIYGLIISLSACGSSVYNFFRVKKQFSIRLKFSNELIHHLKPILLLFFNNIAVIIYVNSDITILGIAQNDHIVGVYGAAVKIYSVTKKIIQSIVIATLPRMSFCLSNNDIKGYKNILRKESCAIVSIVVPTLCGLFMVAQNAILLVSGPNYLEGVTALRVLCIALFFSAIATILTTSILLPRGEEKTILFSTLAASFINVILNIILIPTISLNGAALTTALAELIVVVLCLRKAKDLRFMKMIFSTLIKSIVGCIGIVGCCVFISNLKLPFIYDINESCYRYIVRYYLKYWQEKIRSERISIYLGSDY